MTQAGRAGVSFPRGATGTVDRLGVDAPEMSNWDWFWWSCRWWPVAPCVSGFFEPSDTLPAGPEGRAATYRIQPHIAW